MYCSLLVTVAMVEGSYHLSRGQGSSLSSAGNTSLECSVLECGQVYSTVRCVACKLVPAVAIVLFYCMWCSCHYHGTPTIARNYS
jgi:hypothetical protein